MNPIKELQISLLSSVKSLIPKEKFAILFSSGLDSTLLAKICSLYSKPTLICIGIKNSHDLIEAKKATKQLNLKLLTKTLSKKEIIYYFKAVKKALPNSNLLQIEIATSELAAMSFARKKGYKIIFMGQGPDELFAGYNYFKKIYLDGGQKLVKEKINQLVKDNYKINLYRDYKMAKLAKVKLILPYLEKNFVKAALKLPVRHKILSSNDDLRKHTLRIIGKNLSLPKNLYNKRKKAIQYSSGISKVIKKHLKVFSKLQGSYICRRSGKLY